MSKLVLEGAEILNEWVVNTETLGLQLMHYLVQFQHVENLLLY